MTKAERWRPYGSPSLETFCIFELPRFPATDFRQFQHDIRSFSDRKFQAMENFLVSDNRVKGLVVLKLTATKTVLYELTVMFINFIIILL